MVNNLFGEYLGTFTLLGVNPDKKIGFIQDYESVKAISVGLAQLNPYQVISDNLKAYFLYSSRL